MIECPSAIEFFPWGRVKADLLSTDFPHSRCERLTGCHITEDSRQKVEQQFRDISISQKSELWRRKVFGDVVYEAYARQSKLFVSYSVLTDIRSGVRDVGTYKCAFHVDYTIKDIFFCSFSSCITVKCEEDTDESRCEIYVGSFDGHDVVDIYGIHSQQHYGIKFPFQVLHISPFSNGLLISRGLRPSEMPLSNNESNSRKKQQQQQSQQTPFFRSPTVFALVHPLDEVSPVVAKTPLAKVSSQVVQISNKSSTTIHDITTSACEQQWRSTFWNSANQRVIHVDEEFDLVFVGNVKTGVHYAWRLTQALREDIDAVLTESGKPVETAYLTIACSPAIGHVTANSSRLSQYSIRDTSQLGISRLAGAGPEIRQSPLGKTFNQQSTSSVAGNGTSFLTAFGASNSMNANISTTPSMSLSTNSANFGVGFAGLATSSPRTTAAVAEQITRRRSTIGAQQQLSGIGSPAFSVNARLGIAATQSPGVQTRGAGRTPARQNVAGTTPNTGRPQIIPQAPDFGLLRGFYQPMDADAAEPVLPTHVLEQVWVEPVAGLREPAGLMPPPAAPINTAVKAFVARDLRKATFLCYLLKSKMQLRCVEFTRTETSLVFHTHVAVIPALDAIPIRPINMTLIIDPLYNLELLSGSVKVCKVLLNTSINMIQTPLSIAPVVSASSMLIPKTPLSCGTLLSTATRPKTCGPTTTATALKPNHPHHNLLLDASFGEATMLSPVPADTSLTTQHLASMMTPVGGAALRRPMQMMVGLSTGGTVQSMLSHHRQPQTIEPPIICTRFVSYVGDLIVLELSNTVHIQTIVPPISRTRLVGSCIRCLQTSLTPLSFAQFVGNWYTRTNAPGRVSSRREWATFCGQILQFSGIHVDDPHFLFGSEDLIVLDDSTIDSGGGSYATTSIAVNDEPMTEAKRWRSSAEPADCDWSGLLAITGGGPNSKTPHGRSPILVTFQDTNTNLIVDIICGLHGLAQEIIIGHTFSVDAVCVAKFILFLCRVLSTPAFNTNGQLKIALDCVYRFYHSFLLSANSRALAVFDYLDFGSNSSPVAPIKNSSGIDTLFPFTLPLDFGHESCVNSVAFFLDRVLKAIYSSLPSTQSIVNENAIALVRAGAKLGDILRWRPLIAFVLSEIIGSMALSKKPRFDLDPAFYRAIGREDMYQNLLPNKPQLEMKTNSRTPPLPNEYRIFPQTAKNEPGGGMTISVEDLASPPPGYIEDGMEKMTWSLLDAIFPDDSIPLEIRRLLQSARAVHVSVKRTSHLTDQDYQIECERTLYQICTRVVTLPFGRGAFTLGTYRPSTSQPITPPRLCLSGIIPSTGITVELAHIPEKLHPSDLAWAHFHNGAAAGLSAACEARLFDSTWIQYSLSMLNSIGVLGDAAAAAAAGTTTAPGQPPGSSPATGTPERLHEQAGLLLGLGIGGHLNNINRYHLTMWLHTGHRQTSIGLLLGLCAGKIGSRDPNLFPCLAVHLPVLQPPAALELEVDQLVQTACLLSLGLLYADSGNHYIAARLAGEVGRRPVLPGDPVPVCQEGYVLSAAFGLGLVMLQRGPTDHPPDSVLASDLHQLLIGGRRSPHHIALIRNAVTPPQPDPVPQSHVATVAHHTGIAPLHTLETENFNIHVTSAPAAVALGLMYFDSNDPVVGKWLGAPPTEAGLRMIPPDILLIRTVSCCLVNWSKVRPDDSLMEAFVPKYIRAHAFNGVLLRIGLIDVETISASYCAIISGLCFAIGLRFAGSGLSAVSNFLLRWTDFFLEALNNPTHLKLVGRCCLERGIATTVLSAAMVMSGRGDQRTLSYCRYLLARCEKIRTAHNALFAPLPSIVLSYGTNVAASIAVGLLGLGACSMALRSSRPIDVAILFLALYPVMPVAPSDNRYHLQAFRHLYALAAEQCVLAPEFPISPVMTHSDIFNKLTQQIIVEVSPSSTAFEAGGVTLKRRLTAPCQLPALESLSRVEIYVRDDCDLDAVDSSGVALKPPVGVPTTQSLTLLMSIEKTDIAAWSALRRAICENRGVLLVQTPPDLSELAHVEQLAEALPYGPAICRILRRLCCRRRRRRTLRMSEDTKDDEHLYARMQLPIIKKIISAVIELRSWTSLPCEQRRLGQPLSSATVTTLVDIAQTFRLLSSPDTPIQLQSALATVASRFGDVIRLLAADVEQCVFTVLASEEDACHGVEELVKSAKMPPNVAEPLQSFCLLAASWLDQATRPPVTA